MLYFLAFLPACFLVFDLYSLFVAEGNLAKQLRIIATANLVYCGLSLSLAAIHSESLMWLGWGYLAIEAIIVVGIGLFELRVATWVDTDG